MSAQDDGGAHFSERWLPVAGFEGLYEISNLGRARSVEHWITRKGKAGSTSQTRIKARMLALSPHTGGYRMLHLYRAGKRTPVLVHRAVMEAFVGPKPPGLEILHADDNKENCRLSNLSYGTHKENEAGKVARGRSARGERNGSTKLTADQVAEIRSRRGEKQRDLAVEYGCTFGNISAIQLGKSWSHLPATENAR